MIIALSELVQFNQISEKKNYDQNATGGKIGRTWKRRLTGFYTSTTFLDYLQEDFWWAAHKEKLHGWQKRTFCVTIITAGNGFTRELRDWAIFFKQHNTQPRMYKAQMAKLAI